MADASDVCKYKMDHKNRGIAVIINNDIFKNFPRREGTEIDEKQLEKRLEDLHFNVQKHQNKSSRDMKSIVKTVASQDHRDSDCFVCVILSHGTMDMVYGSDDREVEVNDLVEPFKGDKCRSLVGKPKIFFIQACRGDKLHDGALGVKSDGDDEDEKRIPIEADFLLAYSCVPGYFAWRSKEKGSWFIQALCEALEKYGSRLDLMTLMTRVNMTVASRKSESDKYPNKKEIPCITSMLTKDIYFTK